MPCRLPGCPPVTDLVCRACKRPVAVISYQSASVIVFACPACASSWHWDEPNGAATH
jgi:hypothetical protein